MTSSSRRQKVLIVDDERLNRQILTDLLADQRDVVLAKNGPQALRKAQEHCPDLILLDVMMPDMDGFEVLRRLKSNNKTKDIAVIIVSALDSPGDEAKGLILGALDYITKPFHPVTVNARVRNILNLENRRKMLEQMANLDGLTGISNRRKFDETLDKAWRHGMRHQLTLAMALIDVDHFKPFNDQYGHALGDEALCRVAHAISGCLNRPFDLCARYGGEEFVLLLPDTDVDGACRVAEKVRAAVQALAIPHAGSSIAEVVTVSIGCATCIPMEDSEPLSLIKAADEMLYLAKNQGRNQIMWQQANQEGSNA
ncbi:diguanylate cyclase domain-containing protein [Nitrincola sp. MINF-07-Sa-05]|uniref:diguanylate cyclase domain-containing protein n=1 Tax=Nitrincola salilacus TaxID=3400273 RepID=UPI0039184D73